MTVKKSVTPQEVKAPEVKEKPNLKYLRDKDREMVKGIFRFHEVPGGSMSFSLLLHKGDKVETYAMVDGQVYTVPRGVARHLNKNVKYPIHGHLMGENEIPIMKVSQWVRRCSFQSLEFLDDEEPNHDSVIQVEYSGTAGLTGV